jgi:hypothetical protein
MAADGKVVAVRSCIAGRCVHRTRAHPGASTVIVPGIRGGRHTHETGIIMVTTPADMSKIRPFPTLRPPTLRPSSLGGSLRRRCESRLLGPHLVHLEVVFLIWMISTLLMAGTSAARSPWG